MEAGPRPTPFERRLTLQKWPSQNGGESRSESIVGAPTRPSASRNSILEQRPRKRSVMLKTAGDSRPKFSRSTTTRSSLRPAAAPQSAALSAETSSSLAHKTRHTSEMWSKVRAAVKVASAIGHLNKESETARRQRVRRHWDVARQIARAALSLSAITNKRAQDDSNVGIKSYTRFVKLLDSHPSARTDSDLDFMMNSTSHLAIFSAKIETFGNLSGDTAASDVTVGTELTQSQHREICRIMKMRTFHNSHEFVFRQGDTGEEFFIILEGSVLVQRDVNNSGVAHTVAKLEAGGSFGEIALSTRYTVRTAAVVTIEPCVFLVIHKDDYQRILQNTHQEVFDRKMRFLRSVPALQDLTDKEFFNLCISLHTYRIRAGVSIVREGDMLDPLRFFIIVKRGELEVRKLISRGNAQASAGVANAQPGTDEADNRARRDETTLLPPTSPQTKTSSAMTLCVMGASESICDHRSLSIREDVDYRYPFSVVANTLCEYYCISKHDLFGKLSRDSLKHVQTRILHFPDERLLRNAYAASRGWVDYKASLVAEVLANKEVRGPAGFARLSPYNGPTVSARPRPRLVDFEIERKRTTRHSPTSATPRKVDSTRRATRSSIVQGSGKRHSRARVSCFERSRRASAAARAAEGNAEAADIENTDSMPVRKAYACVADVKLKTSGAGDTQLEILSVNKRASTLTGNLSALSSLERSKIRAKNRAALSRRLAEGAHELDDLLADGFSLTRHVYANALSQGARFYCQSLAFWADDGS